MTNELRAAALACRAILVKLQQINDAPTSRLRPGPTPPKYAESRIPEGVRVAAPLTGDHAPSKQFSLWAHYSYRMNKALERQDAFTLLKLAACATRDYEIHQRSRPGFHQNHEAAVTELLRDCVGVTATEASWFLGAPVEWVRRQRVLNGRDPEFGEPRGQLDALTARVLELAEEGKSLRFIAAEVHMSKSAVDRLLKRVAQPVPVSQVA